MDAKTFPDPKFVMFTEVAGPVIGKTGARFTWHVTVRSDGQETEIEELGANTIALIKDVEMLLIKHGCIPRDAYIDNRREAREQPQPTSVPPVPPSEYPPTNGNIKRGTGQLEQLTINPGGKIEFKVSGLNYPLKDSRGAEIVAGLFDKNTGWTEEHLSQPAIFGPEQLANLKVDWEKPEKYYNVVRIYR